MERINLPKATQLTSPNPVTLICTEKPDGTTNLATISWWTTLSFNPAMVCFAMMKPSYSGERVRETRRAVITVPGSNLVEAVIGCGTTSGRNTDKIAKFGIEMQKLTGVSIQIPKDARVAIVCRLKEHHETGDHNLYICEVEVVLSDPVQDALFAWNGYAEIAPARKG